MATYQFDMSDGHVCTLIEEVDPGATTRERR